jgi:hypothetical protein
VRRAGLARWLGWQRRPEQQRRRWPGVERVARECATALLLCSALCAALCGLRGQQTVAGQNKAHQARRVVMMVAACIWDLARRIMFDRPARTGIRTGIIAAPASGMARATLLPIAADVQPRLSSVPPQCLPSAPQACPPKVPQAGPNRLPAFRRAPQAGVSQLSGAAQKGAAATQQPASRLPSGLVPPLSLLPCPPPSTPRQAPAPLTTARARVGSLHHDVCPSSARRMLAAVQASPSQTVAGCPPAAPQQTCSALHALVV